MLRGPAIQAVDRRADLEREAVGVETTLAMVPLAAAECHRWLSSACFYYPVYWVPYCPALAGAASRWELAAASLAVARRVGRTGAEAAMVGQSGGSRAVVVAAIVAIRPAWPVVRFEEDFELAVGAAGQVAAARVVERFEAGSPPVTEAALQTAAAAAAGDDESAGQCLVTTEFAPVAAGKGSSFVVSLGLERFAHAAERSAAEGLARFVD